VERLWLTTVASPQGELLHQLLQLQGGADLELLAAPLPLQFLLALLGVEHLPLGQAGTVARLHHGADGIKRK
jgi:hypothetical protein